MNYLISENQMQTILIESVRERLSENAKKLNDIAKEIIDDVQINNGLNFKFLLTWGASIGGLMGPLKSWIENKYTGMDPHDVALLTLGAVATYFYDNENKIKSLYKKIKDKGLSTEFQEIRDKSDQFKSVFINFLASIGITTSNMINTMSYAFIIPILDDLYSLILNSNNTQDMVLHIGKRLAASGVVLVTGALLRTLIKKLAVKFQQTD
jgi:hypothetical protein